MTGRDLGALFNPHSVAIVGASNDTNKYGNWLSVQALRDEDRRAVHLVNRSGRPVLGRATLKSLHDLPGRVELAVIATPVASFEETVDDALRAGARAIVGITAGFAELGREGAALQERVTRRVRDAGAVLLGPNCLGIMDSTTHLSLLSNVLPAGSVSLLSQSGNMAIELGQFLSGHGLGFARFASLGNQADLAAAELIRACAEHAGTRLIALYCEDFKDGRELVRAAAAARRQGKPVVLLTVGGSEASVRGAKSHTGALTSATAVIDAACRAAGIYRVASPRELADVAAALLAFGMRPAQSVAVIADGGGHASIASDLAEAAGLRVREFPADTRRALANELPPSAGVANPVDIAGAGEHDVTVFERLTGIVLRDRSVDAALLTGGFGIYRDYGEAMARAEAATAEGMSQLAVAAGKPLLVHTMWPQSESVLAFRRHGIPVFRAVEDAVRTLAVIARASPPVADAARPNRSGLAVADEDYMTARSLLAGAGIRFPRAERVASLEEALASAEHVGFPVVLKAMGLLHKSDAGGVALGLADAGQLARVFKDMHQRLAARAYSIEAMARAEHAIELIVGTQVDPHFGPIVMVGLGGVLTEVLHDVAFALAPVGAADARALLESLKSAALLHGVRGKPAVDVEAAAVAVARLSEVAAAHPEIGELEINPLLVSPDGAQGLDARLVLAAHGAASAPNVPLQAGPACQA